MGLSTLISTLKFKLLLRVLRLLMWWNEGRAVPHPTSTIRIPSRDSSRSITAHLYAPPKPNPTSNTNPTPILLNFHGSGYVFALHGRDSSYCAHIAETTGHTVLDIQYRLAPEHPFPACHDDAADVVAWLRTQPTTFDLSRLSLSGFSAGAAIALVAATTLPKGAVRAVLAFYPTADWSIEPEARVAPDPTGDGIPPWMMRFFARCWIPKDVNVRDPRVSPVYADVRRFPGAVAVFTGARDVLAFEGEALAGRLEGVEGVRVVRRRYEGCGHNFDKGSGEDEVRARDDAYARVVEILKG